MFVQLTPEVSVAGQLTPADIAAAAAEGFTVVVNNRPDNEVPGQPADADLRAAAEAAGLRYAAIPVDHSGFLMVQIDAMAAELASGGRLLAFCRSGTRSANLWALAAARQGGDPDAIAAAAASGRYDVSALLPALRKLSAR